MCEMIHKIQVAYIFMCVRKRVGSSVCSFFILYMPHECFYDDRTRGYCKIHINIWKPSYEIFKRVNKM